MGELQLVKTSKFGDIQCDVYSDEKEMFMTAEQLGECLGYAEARKSVGNLVKRNEYLENSEFSSVIKMMTPSGEQNTRVFTEDGIYEVTMLAKTEKAKEFRAWVRKLLKTLRKGENKIIKATEYQKLNAEAKLNNSRARMASILLKIAEKTSIPEYKQVMCSYASSVIAGKPLLPLPTTERKTYSATEIGKMLGITANKVGSLANQYNLKTQEYGKLFYDKSKYSNKEVETFRYYIEVVSKLEELLKINTQVTLLNQ